MPEDKNNQENKTPEPALQEVPQGEVPQTDDDEYEWVGPSRLTLAYEWALRNRKFTVPGLITLVIMLTMAVPATRYGVLGKVIKKEVKVTVMNSEYNLPATGVSVDYSGSTAITNNNGEAVFYNVPVGPSRLVASQKYYESHRSTLTTGIFGQNEQVVLINPEGQTIPIKIIDKQNSAFIGSATVQVAGVSAVTNKQGEAFLVLPENTDKLIATVSVDNYKTEKFEITVNRLLASENTFGLTRAD